MSTVPETLQFGLQDLALSTLLHAAKDWNVAAERNTS